MPRYAPNKMPAAVKRRYFELIREGMPGAEAARQVGVSTSCGSLWFIDAGSVRVFEPTPISRRFLSQDDRIEIADGLGCGEPVKSIAARIGKSYQAVYREIARNGKPDGSPNRRPPRRPTPDDALRPAPATSSTTTPTTYSPPTWPPAPDRPHALSSPDRAEKSAL